MKDQEQLTQEICNELSHAVESDVRVLAAKKKVEEADNKAFKAWIGLALKRASGASLENMMQEVIPLEEKLLKLKAHYLNIMGEAFEEKKASYGLPKDVGFFDFFLHPLDDQELMRTIVDLITFYEEMSPYRKGIKKLAKNRRTWEPTMGFAPYLVEIERIKISIELSARTCSDIGKRFLRLLKTLPTTNITKELTAYFETVGCLGNAR